MLFHVSLEADRPRHAAEVMAEILGGEALPFPFVGEGSWVALAGDDRGTIIEFYPRGTEMHPGEDGAVGVTGAVRRNGPVHIAIATPLEADEVIAIAERERWHVQTCERAGGAFSLIEVWLDNCQLVEVLTAGMQQDYLRTITIENWRGMLRAQELAEAA